MKTGSAEHLQMHSRSDNSEMTGLDTEKTIEELFQSTVQGHHVGLEKAIKGSNFVLIILMDYITSNLLH